MWVGATRQESTGVNQARALCSRAVQSIKKNRSGVVQPSCCQSPRFRRLPPSEPEPTAPQPSPRPDQPHSTEENKAGRHRIEAERPELNVGGNSQTKDPLQFLHQNRERDLGLVGDISRSARPRLVWKWDRGGECAKKKKIAALLLLLRSKKESMRTRVGSASVGVRVALNGPFWFIASPSFARVASEAFGTWPKIATNWRKCLSRCLAAT